MPVYEFKCPECGTRDELESKMSLIEHRVLYCIHCNVDMKRVFNAPGLVFKGTGWAGKNSETPTTSEKSS